MDVRNDTNPCMRGNRSAISWKPSERACLQCRQDTNNQVRAVGELRLDYPLPGKNLLINRDFKVLRARLVTFDENLDRESRIPAPPSLVGLG
jgi:hypothetical protein